MAVRITVRAAEELAKRGTNILFSVKGGGCNGFEYVLKPCGSAPDQSEKQTEFNGVTLHTCRLSIFHLLGTTIDWNDDIMGSRFVFRNPNAQSTCGCGSTFSS